MDVQEFLHHHRQAMEDDLRDFVERETPSTDRDRLHQFADFLTRYARDAGGRVEIIESDSGNRHLRAEWGSSSAAPVLLLGHYDTVWPVGTLASIPFSNDDGVARGPGVFDMKAGLVQGFWALRALREIGSERRVVFLCTSDEEVGSDSSRGLIETEAANASAVFVLEASHDGALKTARKGVAGFRIEITGRAAHAGIEPEAGRSAIEELAHVILDLHGLSDSQTGSTVNVGVIAGGTRPNVVAQQATAEADVRFLTQREADRITTAILGLQPHRDGIEVHVTGGINRPPMERTAGTAALFAQARTIAADLGFPLDEVAVGGASDGNFCSAMGVPVLDGLGAVGGGAHATSEHVVLEQMPVRAALVAHLLAAV